MSICPIEMLIIIIIYYLHKEGFSSIVLKWFPSVNKYIILKRRNIQHVASVGQRKNLSPQTGIEPMTFRTLVGRSNHWATGRLVASIGHIYWVRGDTRPAYC